jgi:type IV pilus assembly protein PilO
MALLPQEPRKQYMLLAIIVAVASAALYWNFVWTPQSVELAALEARLDTLDSHNAIARTRIARGTVAELEAEAEQAARDLEVMRMLVPTGNELPSLLEQVSTAARREGLDISGVDPQPVIEGNQFDTYRYKLTVTGGYHALGEFLTNVGTLTRIVAPVNLNLSLSGNTNLNAVRLAPAGTAPIQSVFEIQTYVIRSAPPARGGQS